MSAHPHHKTTEGRYHRAHLPQEARTGEIIHPCFHCGQQIALRRWDSWNGFLVECPHCHALHGKRWNIKVVLMAGFMFHALSFFFTMRPRQAFLSIAGFGLFAFTGNYILDHFQIPDIAAVAGAAVFMLGPLLVNAVLLIKHEHDFDKRAPLQQIYS